MGYCGFDRCRLLKYFPCFPIYCHAEKFGCSRRAREITWDCLDFFSGTSRCQALVPPVPLPGGSSWREPWAEYALSWSLMAEAKWVVAQSGHQGQLPYRSHSCHRSPCHTSYRWWGFVSMENRIAAVEWPSCRGFWGASHRRDSFEVFFQD